MKKYLKLFFVSVMSCLLSSYVMPSAEAKDKTVMEQLASSTESNQSKKVYKKGRNQLAKRALARKRKEEAERAKLEKEEAEKEEAERAKLEKEEAEKEEAEKARLEKEEGSYPETPPAAKERTIEEPVPA